MQSKQSVNSNPETKMMTVRRMLLVEMFQNHTYIVKVVNVWVEHLQPYHRELVDKFIDEHPGDEIHLSKYWERILATSPEDLKDSLHFLTLPSKISGIFVDFSKKTVKFVLKPNKARELVLKMAENNPSWEQGFEFIDVLGNKQKVFVNNFGNSAFLNVEGIV